MNSFLHSSFLFRLVRSFLYSFNGEALWRELVGRLDHAYRSSYIRLNVPLPAGESVRLDDASKMEFLKDTVRM